MKKIIISITTIIILIVIGLTLNNETTEVSIERDTEYTGPNVDSPSIIEETIEPTF